MSIKPGCQVGPQLPEFGVQLTDLDLELPCVRLDSGLKPDK